MRAVPSSESSTRAHVLIAVKDLRHAKSRLTPRLDAAERGALALAMLRDTVTAALSSVAVVRVTVITPDEAVAAVAAELGVALFPDPLHNGLDAGSDRLNAALDAAAGALPADTPVVALQGDLPCLSGSELTEALAAASRVGRAVVVDHHGTGTAALIATAGDLGPRFGEDSARRHIDSGATALTGTWPGLRLDVDTPADLDAAATLGLGDATSRELRRMGERL